MKEQYVKLLAPQILHTEWTKHREKEKSNVLRSVRNLTNEARIRRTINDPGLPFFQEDLDEIKSKLLSQITIIDELLAENALTISLTDAGKVAIFEQQEERKAPFTDRTKDNLADAILIFSSLEEIEKRGDNELYFVSGNTVDFASPGAEPPVLHSDIAEHFLKVTVHYHTDIRDTFKAFDKLGFPRYKKPKADNKGKVERIIEIDKSKPLLEQLHDYLTARFSEISILPKRLFTNHYPFLLGTDIEYPPKPFTLVTDNQDLFDLLTGIQFEYGKVTDSTARFLHTEEDERKANEIMHLLAHNFLHRIAFKSGKEVALSRPPATSLCDCSLCLYEDLRWAELLRKDLTTVSDKSLSLESRMRLAYGFYKSRDFLQAAKLFEALREEAKTKQGLTHYIVEFNLQHLGFLITHSYWDEANAMSYGKELKEIDLNNVFKKCRTTENAAALQWLHEKEFYQTTLTYLLEKQRSIVDLYHNGSSGFNEGTYSLLESYYSIEAFLNHNSIIYDIYREYDTLTHIFTEGVFASHNQNPRMGGRLNQFDDYLMELLLLGGEPEVLRSYFRRYKLERLSYKQTNTFGYDLILRLQKFLSTYPAIKEAYEAQTKPLNPSFWEDYNKILQNGLTLLAMSNIFGTPVNDFAGVLITFLQTQNHLHLYPLEKSINYFLSRKHEELCEDTLTRLFMLGVENDHLRRDDEYVDLLEDAFKKRSLKLSLTDDQFNHFATHFFRPPADNEMVHSLWFPGTLHTLTNNEEHSQAIRDWISIELQANFQVRRYYNACMFDLLTPSEPLLTQYVHEVEEVANKGQQLRFMPSHDYYSDDRIDQFLNFCFKYSFSISASLRASIAAVSPYYEWMLNLDGFEYAKFNTEWLTHHFTVYYKHTLRRSEALKRYLLEYMKTHHHSGIEKTFIMIYGYDD